MDPNYTVIVLAGLAVMALAIVVLGRGRSRR
jgi:hypothetical protein